MNKLSLAERASVVRALVEGNSVNSTARITGVSKPAILKLLADLGAACQKYHDERVRGLASKRIQCDEIWSFCYAKGKNVPADKRGQFGYGDVWTWTALDADSKLIVSYTIGPRDTPTAQDFMGDVASRLANRVQLTTDGHKAYLQSVGDAFDWDVDYTMLIKLYGSAEGGAGSGGGRYSPPPCIGIKLQPIVGNPDPAHISTSFVERQNLTMRMSIRRFTRLTNAFSKKIENHGHMIALFFAYYNFCRVHQTTKKTPAVAAGLTDHAWKVEELVALLPVKPPTKRGPYKARAALP
jgi:IS1 family transposase